MGAHVYKVVEIVGTSSDSFEKAVECAVSEAARSVRDLRWFEVTDTRGHIRDGKIEHWQVKLKIGFTVEASKAGGS
jgi:flavin-binding protein dodecin